MNTEKQNKIGKLPQDNDEALLRRRILDLDSLCQKRYSAMSTAFLSETQIACCESVFHLIDSNYKVWGGYDGAQRCVAILLPDENYEMEDDEIPFTALELKCSAKIGHRDILGSILGLGIERDTVGDILVGERSSYVFVLKDIANYIEQNLIKIGRQNVTVKRVGLDEVEVPEIKTEEINATVMSLRLDSVIAEGFGLSRENAKNAVEKQLVQLNHKIVDTPSHNIKKKDVISLRGKGKIIMNEVCGESRKGRIRIKILRFV